MVKGADPKRDGEVGNDEDGFEYGSHRAMGVTSGRCVPSLNFSQV